MTVKSQWDAAEIMSKRTETVLNYYKLNDTNKTYEMPLHFSDKKRR